MKKRIVLWGENAQNEKILVALELLDKENKVALYTFNQAIATEEFYTKIMNLWREGNDLPFPEGYTRIERDLSVTGELLPEEIKVDRTDIISRAKAEWHFVVLSAKLHEIYKTELEDIKDRVNQLKEYDDKIWDEMKGFWAKVQGQTFEKNIFREHANDLKEETNKIFDKLKELRKVVEQRFRIESREKATVFMNQLKEIEEKVEKGLGLKPIFEELKNIQQEFKKEDLARRDQRTVWDKIDALFKVVKEKRFGDKAQTGNRAHDRISRRKEGLVSAIRKMEASINRDKKEQDFQVKRISETDGQLEAQIRQAKMKMIEERISSKQIKLDDMHKTLKELDVRITKEEEKLKKKEEKNALEKKKAEIKAKISSEITEAKSENEANASKLQKAAEEINDSIKPKATAILEKITEEIQETVEDVSDTVKAIAEVIGDKIEDVVEKLTEEE